MVALAGVVSAQWHSDLRAGELPHNTCHRLAEGSAVPEPEDLRSRNGELTVDLRIHNYSEDDGSIAYCYTKKIRIRPPALTTGTQRMVTEMVLLVQPLLAEDPTPTART